MGHGGLERTWGTGGDAGTRVDNQILGGTQVTAKPTVRQEGEHEGTTKPPGDGRGHGGMGGDNQSLWGTTGCKGTQGCGVWGGSCLSFPTRASSCPVGETGGQRVSPHAQGAVGFPSPGGVPEVSHGCPMGVPWVSPLSHLVGLHGPAQVLDPAVALGQGRAPKGPAALACDDLGAGRVSWWWWWWGHPRVLGGGCTEGFGCPWLRGCPFRVPWVPLWGAWGASPG